MAGTIDTQGKNALADGIGQHADLQLVATVSTSEKATVTVTFNAASGGVIDLTGNATLTIPAGNTISHVYLREIGETLSNNLAFATLSSDNAFPSGGDLIVTSFEITVT